MNLPFDTTFNLDTNKNYFRLMEDLEICTTKSMEISYMFSNIRMTVNIKVQNHVISKSVLLPTSKLLMLLDPDILVLIL